MTGYQSFIGAMTREPEGKSGGGVAEPSATTAAAPKPEVKGIIVYPSASSGGSGSNAAATRYFPTPGR